LWVVERRTEAVQHLLHALVPNGVGSSQDFWLELGRSGHEDATSVENEVVDDGPLR
jgi:hypothetical protein